MAGVPKRTVLEDENLDIIIGVLKKIIKALEDTKEYKMSFASACKEHGLNWQKVRRNLLSISKCQLTDTVPIKELIKDEYDNYEKLYYNVFGMKTVEEVRACLPYDYVQTVEYVLTNQLMEREAMVLRFRFGLTKEGLPLILEDVRKILGVSSERARQIERKALRKLRHPSRSRILMKGISLYEIEHGKSQKEHYDNLVKCEIAELEQKIENLTRENEALKKQYFEIKKQNSEIKNHLKQQISDEETSQISQTLLKKAPSLINETIDQLELDARVYNTLKRSGRNRIEDVLNTKKEDLKKIRGLGAATEKKIENCLDLYLQENYNITLVEYHNAVHSDSVEQYIS